MDPEHFQESEDGHEMTFAVNVLAHHFLTHRLKVHTTHHLSIKKQQNCGSGIRLFFASGIGAVLRIRDVFPGSDFFPSRIRIRNTGSGLSFFRVPDRQPIF
jgi:hypothetical protein